MEEHRPKKPGSSLRRHPVLAENTHPSRYQPIRPLFDIGVAVATGDSSLIRGTPCRHTGVWQGKSPCEPGVRSEPNTARS
jgi:hypothetical protein